MDSNKNAQIEKFLLTLIFLPHRPDPGALPDETDLTDFDNAEDRIIQLLLVSAQISNSKYQPFRSPLHTKNN